MKTEFSEQRAHPRQPLYLDVTVSRGDLNTVVYEARDFCRGGMLLLAKESGDHATEMPLSPGDEVSISLSAQDQGGVSEFHFDARIARVFDGGIGVAFSYIEPKALHLLQQLADLTLPQPEASSSETGVESFVRDEVLKQCSKVISPHLTAVMQDFLKRADDKLIDQARMAKNNNEQGDYFETLAEITRFRSSIAGVFLDAVLERLEGFRYPSRILEQPLQEELQSFELSIVDPDEFEHWVAVSAMSAKIQANFAGELYDLRQRLSALFGVRSLDEKINPVGPGAICHAFRESIKVLHVRPPVSDAVYGVFEGVVIPHLTRLYIDLNKLLVDSKVLPVIARTPVVQESSMPPAKTVKPAEKTATAEAIASTDMMLGPEGAPQANAYSTAIELLNLRRQGERGGSRLGMVETSVMPQESASGSVADELRAIVKVLHSLPRIEELDVKSELLSAIQRGDMAQGLAVVSPQLADTIEVGASLIDSILDDELLADVIKPYIKRLKVTLLKVALQDQRLFSSPTHPARQFLDLLAQLRSGPGRLSVDSDSELKHAIEVVVNRIDRHYDHDPGVFSEAVEDLTPIMKRQEESFTRNVYRVVKACQGAEKVTHARRLIRDEISQRLVGKQVPSIVLELLRLGWPKLLFVSLLRKGSDSREWRDNLGVIDQLLHLLDDDSGKEGPESPNVRALMTAIEQGLDYICSYSFRLKELLAQLEVLLTGRQQKQDVPPCVKEQVDQAMVDSLLGYSVDSDIASQNAITEEGLWDDKVGRQREYLLKAKALKAGDWLQYAHPAHGQQLVKMVWMDEGHLHHVFVDRRGIKVLELGFYELASQLKSGMLTVLEEDEPSLFDRGLHRMLQQMHERLAFQATHDPQTGLLNRKEFHKQLEFVLADAKPQSERHALCHIDFGNFKLINSVCGFDAEEELLQQIVSILEEKAGEDAVLARLGDAKFGLLLGRCIEAEACGVTEGLRNAFHEYRFSWQDEVHSVTTSTGLVMLSEDCETVDELVKMADAACYAAKDAGINRIQLYQADDAELARRHGVMQWVTRINTVLDKGEIELYCQRIAPLSEDAALHTHYEILMRVVADDGAHMSPVTFIKAAELSNKMVDVDKWIILKVFDWMMDNYRYMHRFGGFAINLSGNSLNDPSFPDFLLDVLGKTNVPADKICFEVTETAAIYNLSNAADFIERVREVGCKFALDDFGSGMASYAYLKHLPVDFVKIDGVFVRDIVSSESDYAMVKSINEICHFLGKQTIAEYIEDEQIRDRLLEIGVDFAQGYFIERPRPLKDIPISDLG